MTNMISCPNCLHEISVSETLHSQLSEQIRKKLESELGGKQAEIAAAQKTLADQARELDAQRQSLNEQVKAAVDAQRAQILDEARKQVSESMRLELQDSAAQVKELQSKLSAAQQHELELRKKERALESKAEELKLTVARELDAERVKIRESAMQQFADEHQLKDAEQQKMIAEMRRQIDDLKRKAEQGSVQTQGEVQELALEELLTLSFPHDTIEPVGKGINGADTTQRVFCGHGTECGSILWESKRTKSFSKVWLPKLRDDQRAVRASVAVLVTQAMPEGVDTFAQIDGVWVCSWKCAKALAMVLRCGLIEVGKSKLAMHGQTEKMELVYHYLSSSGFQQRVEGVVEAFISMQSDLDSERRSMKRIWSKREKQIERALSNTAGLYGDLQGIIGGSLPAIEHLSLDRIASDREMIKSL